MVLTRVDESVLAVPEDAISTLAGVSTVYVIENGKARQQQVTLGARQDKLVEVDDRPEGRRDARHDQPEPARHRRQRAAGRRRRRRDGAGPARSTPMNIAEVSVKRPVFAIMMTAALIVLGACLVRVARPRPDAEDRRAGRHRCRPTCPAPAPRRSRRRSPSAIEEAVNTISGIDELRASSDQGNSRVTITFTLERDIESATQDVRDKLAQIVNQFPRDTRPLQITKMDPDAQPIFGFAVYGPRAPKEMTEIAEKRSSRSSRRSRTSARSATTASASARSSCC